MTLSENDDTADTIGIPSPGDERAVVDLRVAVLTLVDQLVLLGFIGPATSEKVRALLVEVVP
ncbi:MAG TPA: hypothetical protein VK233_01170 [Candidatus Dormibacteraeota bacterium]|nr:hypothetical protein [Candidatus Dormibacteraeota bacterium]